MLTPGTIIRILLFGLIIYFGIGAVQTEMGGTEAGLFATFDQLHFILLIVLLLVELALAYKAYKSAQKVLHFLPLCIGTALLTFCMFKKAQHNAIENSATVLRLTNKAGAANTWIFEFKEDNNFKLVEYSRLGQVFYYGKYHRNNNELSILQSNYDGFNNSLPTKGRTVADTFYWENSDTMIVEKQEPSHFNTHSNTK